jgi:hypothetical protein
LSFTAQEKNYNNLLGHEKVKEWKSFLFQKI